MDPEAESDAPTHLPDLQPPPAGSLNVLVVENHADTRRGMRIFLRALGHRTAGADSFAAALALAERMRFDVLLSDLSLPDGDGWRLLEQLTARGRRPPHAIAMSGLGGAADRARSRQAGYEMHLVKPFPPGDLEGALRGMVPARPTAPAPPPDTPLQQRMHDGLCQQLAAAALLQGALVHRLEKMARTPADGPWTDAIAEARHINDVLDGAITETQALMREIRDDEGEPPRLNSPATPA